MKKATIPVILIAEDDSSDEHLLKWAFTKAGLKGRIYFVHDGAEAMDYLLGILPFNDRCEYPFPNLLITDLKMPRVDGFELLAWLRQLNYFRALPVIVMSGSSWEQDFERARLLGVTEYLNKGLEFPQLVQAIQSMWRGLFPRVRSRNRATGQTAFVENYRIHS